MNKEKMALWATLEGLGDCDLCQPETSADIRKRLILEIARSGGPKPSRKDERHGNKGLGQYLSAYVNKRKNRPDSEFDEAFANEVKTLRPEWFACPSIVKKEMLLEKAKNGVKKADLNTEMSNALRCYTSKYRGTKKASTYDEEFFKKIKHLAPQWFKEQNEKNALIRLAKLGKPRPKANFKNSKTIAKALMWHTTPSHPYYDAKFDDKIRKLRPDWF